jgi:pilus assembly protein Flp/PilA
MREFFCNLLSDDRGATAIEYGMICALIAISALAGMSAFGNSVDSTWQYVRDNVREATGTG